MLMMVAMAVCCMAANAQNEVGQLTIQPKIGANLSTITGAKVNDESANLKFGFVVGAEAEYGLAPNFSVAAGVLYSQQGCDFGEYKVSIPDQFGNIHEGGWSKNQSKVAYLNIPIVANYYLAPGIAIKAGIQPGFLLSAKQKLDGIGETPSTDTDYKDACNTFDLSIPIGISYESDNFVIDGRYNLGLTKINKESISGEKDNRNSVIQVTIGYKFAL